jgi:bifunctional non-homologous end joining protein LigD
MSRPPAIRPMVLRVFREPFSDSDWLFEVKHDGFRALAYAVDGDCRLVSRKNHIYRTFGPVCDSIAQALKGRDAILDGEIVSLGVDGRSQFKDLMFRRGDPYFYAFDLLWLDNEDLRPWPLIERKKMLRKVVPPWGSRLLYVDHVVGRGEDMFKLVCQRDLEGVIGKWMRGRYMAGDLTSWVKIRNPHYSQIVGREKMFEKRSAS